MWSRNKPEPQTSNGPHTSPTIGVELEEAEKCYQVRHNGQRYTITRKRGARKEVGAWNDLAELSSVQFQQWTFKVGESIRIRMQNNKDDAFALIRQIKDLGDGRKVMFVLWYCSFDDIKDWGCINMEDWPEGRSLMLTTWMDVLMSSTANGKMGAKEQKEVVAEKVVDICRPNQARIYYKGDPFLEWMLQL